MKINNRISYIRKFIYIINVVIIIFFSNIISSTTLKICDSFQARAFIERAQYLPLIPRAIPIFALTSILALGVSNIVKSYLQKHNQYGVSLLLFADFIFCSLIVYYLNFSYRGIFLLLIMNIIFYVKDNKTRIWILLIAQVFYILSDYDILSSRLVMLSLSEYIDYYSTDTKFIILATKNILISINNIGFVVFLYFLLQNKINENRAIRKLNQELQIIASELEVANDQLKDLAKTSEENVKMKERNRLAREIHDIVGHSLTSITTGIEACVELINIDTDLTKTQLNKILDLSRKGLVDIRRSVRELKIDSIAKTELLPAIENLVKDINECTPVKVSLEISGQVTKLKDDENQIVYRIIQESITNSIRHGKATKIQVVILFFEQVLKITVRDNGAGTDEVLEGFGLTHIRERLDMLNGVIYYDSSEHSGFTLNVEIPIRWRNGND
ncbi:MAG: sensor histidine kinase [Clostridium sp.]|nr:sensor histidine kinase [Clostridium sp.]